MLEYERKEQDKFDKKNSKVLTDRDDALKARSKASAQMYASQARIAKKFGFVRVRYNLRRYRSRPSSFDAEADE